MIRADLFQFVSNFRGQDFNSLASSWDMTLGRTSFDAWKRSTRRSAVLLRYTAHADIADTHTVTVPKWLSPQSFILPRFIQQRYKAIDPWKPPAMPSFLVYSSHKYNFLHFKLFTNVLTKIKAGFLAPNIPNSVRSRRKHLSLMLTVSVMNEVTHRWQARTSKPKRCEEPDSQTTPK